MYTYFMQIGMIPIKRDGYGMMNDPVIQLKNVHFRYNEELVLDGINLSVPEGAFVGIVGPNGSGKSTLLKLVLGLLKPVEGEILLFGQKQALFKRQERIGFVSQKANSFNSGFPATVFEVVASGLTRKVGMFRFLKRKDKLDVLQAIRQVGLEPYVNRKIGELSGGQQQRVFIARAIVAKPDVLILDEPTVGVDAKNVRLFYKVLTSLRKEMGITLLMVSHDIEALLNEATHVAYLNKELKFFGDTAEYKKVRMEKQFSYAGF
ncbi:zinc transport system ATP-binding protein [Bacillus thermophilus]|uniref:Zinc transport system ATP-binding protein n=2 Tax=Bacillaceae TaxID=186817 RepID=A0ABS2RBS4_9BACI|nr:zinc transport system ATP-binding protein [Siminovitchia thermophila]